MKLNFTKMHGLGNDFIIIDQSSNPISLTRSQIQFLANRKYGIGCDQILIISSTTKPNSYRYSIFNADGSSASNCGNGARCIIKYISSCYNLTNQLIHLHLKQQIITGYQNLDQSVSINLGFPSFIPQDLPFIHDYNENNVYNISINNQVITFGIASVGNPHAIIQLANLDELSNTKHLTYIAQLLQNSNYFLDGVNVNFYVLDSRDKLQLRTYERGCGFTLACGTGASATASYVISQKQTNSKIVVTMPGGNLILNFDNELIMTGPATEVFNGQICI